MTRHMMFIAVASFLMMSPSLAISRANTSRSSASLRAQHLQGHSRGITDEEVVKTFDFQQILRICNAYPSNIGMELFMGRAQLTTTPLMYKTCQEFVRPLHPGDKVQFQMMLDVVGTFTMSEIPASDAILVLVIYRHDASSTAVAFASHMFTDLYMTQVAVIDTYKGPASSELHIKDVVPLRGDVMRTEMLRYSSVVGLNPGIYELHLEPSTHALENSTNDSVATAEFVALPRRSYVVIRCGVKAVDARDVPYPEEVFVFPHSDKHALGAAMSSHTLDVGILLLVAALFVAA